MRKATLLPALTLVFLATSTRAGAEALTSSDLDVASPIHLLSSQAEGRLMPGFRSAGAHLGAGPQRGWLLGLDAGPQVSTPQPALDPQVALALGVHAGFAFGNGLAMIARYDALGSPALLLPSPSEILLTGGVRYAFAGFPIEPFAEAQFGIAWFEGGALERPGLLGDSATVCGGPALGVLLPFGPSFAISLAGRDWLSFLQGATRQSVAVELGLEFTFASGGAAR